jgi:hypothetical protein
MVKIAYLWSATDDVGITDQRRIKKLPNPLPTDIVTLVTLACSTAGLAGWVYKTIKLWFDAKNAQRIRIRKGDVELEIQGWMSKTKIEQRISEFRRLTRKIDEDDIEVILPDSVDRTLPPDGIDKKKDRRKK